MANRTRARRLERPRQTLCFGRDCVRTSCRYAERLHITTAPGQVQKPASRRPHEHPHRETDQEGCGPRESQRLSLTVSNRHAAQDELAPPLRATHSALYIRWRALPFDVTLVGRVAPTVTLLNCHAHCLIHSTQTWVRDLLGLKKGIASTVAVPLNSSLETSSDVPGAAASLSRWTSANDLPSRCE
jgi:hypothetical protein